MENVNYKTTDLVCEECGGQIVLDFRKNELYCLKCSLVHESVQFYGPLFHLDDYYISKFNNTLPEKVEKPKKQKQNINPNLRIIKKSQYKYIVQTPKGVFDDVNDAITDYPELKDYEKVRQCPVCGKWFYDMSKYKPKKYCSKTCAKNKDRQKRRDDRFYKKYFVNPKIDKPSDFVQKTADYDVRYGDTIDPAFSEDDRYWGLGESNLTAHPKKDNWEREHKYIKKELKRFKKRK